MKRVLVGLLALVGATIVPFVSAAPAQAAVTEYHAYCNQNNCQTAQSAHLWLSSENDTDSSTTFQVYGVKNGNSWQMIPDKLTWSGGGKSGTEPVSASCYVYEGTSYVDHSCHYTVPVFTDRIDLYGHLAFVVSLGVKPGTSAKKGTTLTLSGKVTPVEKGQKVTIQRYYSSAWHSIGTAILSSTGAYSFKQKPTSAGKYLYRAYKPSYANYGSRYSSTLTITVS